MDVTFEPLSKPESLGVEWRALEERADASFFQTWSWIGAWVRALPRGTALYVLRVQRANETVGLALVGRRAVRRFRVLPVRGLFVSETGDPALDTLTVEHSGVLLERGLEATALDAIARTLTGGRFPWDELRVSGIEAKAAPTYRAAWAAAGVNVRTEFEKPYFTVELDDLRASRKDYLSSLSSNTRSQLRRSQREYEKNGPVVIDFATEESEIEDYFSKLRDLHQAYWVARGAPGAFATDFACAFHRELIAEAMPRGEIQLARITSGSDVIGYLYNFRHRGVVSNYQSGIRYTDNSRLKPGLTAHQLAIEHNLANGERVYDLLMGDQRYKKSLSTYEGRMDYLVIQRDRARFKIENAARAVVRRLRRSGDGRGDSSSPERDEPESV
jgi:CelD/BcsL family acetyltransferase involved in cellulose biosynthesis